MRFAVTFMVGREPMDDSVLMEARGLRMHYPVREGLLRRQASWVKAVDGVDLCIRRGETVGLVGESGCGKTTIARCLLHLIRPTAGHVYFSMPGEVRCRMMELEREQERCEGSDNAHRGREPVAAELASINERYSLGAMNAGQLRLQRRNMQMVFQDPYASLNPRMLVKDIVGEPLIVHGVTRGEDTEVRVRELMEMVGLSADHLYRYPHEFSGGQRQRIGIARALALRPELVVLDEPTSALDVSVQAQILNMLNELQSELHLTYLFISHDLSTVRYMSDRVNVMYLGKIVESAPAPELFEAPLHPYTKGLISSIPVPDPARKRDRSPLAGEMPSPSEPPRGCRFHTRCRYRMPRCENEEPPLIEVTKDHFVACHLRSGSDDHGN
jgi:oligopeptide/dipeptide ABC transporter ATP-binding protein